MWITREMNALFWKGASKEGKVAAMSKINSFTKYMPAIWIGLSEGFSGFIVWSLTAMLSIQIMLRTKIVL